MERSTPVRKPRASTADLLTWTEVPPADPSSAEQGAGGSRQRLQPADKVQEVLFGGEVTEEEAQALLKRKPCSVPKWREMTGSGIFSAAVENDDSEAGSTFVTPNSKTAVRICQQAASAISQISFSADESVSPKKPTTLAEVAKQRELSGNLESESEARLQKQISGAKCRELSGHDIFGPPPEIAPKPLAARNLELKGSINFGEVMPPNKDTPARVSNLAGGPSNGMLDEEPVIKTAKKIPSQKFAEIMGNNIFQDDAPSGLVERQLSSAKLREMSGSDIFADGKAASRDYLGGVRKPPGGESNIALV